jgi:predicted outer membrane repeat protein
VAIEARVALGRSSGEVSVLARESLFLVLLWLLAQTASYGRTWYITPDESGDAPTIRAGVDSASIGDTVLVACGTYYEYNIHMKSGIALVSESGEAECATIDAEYQHRVLWCGYCDSVTVIRGFTITHGTPYLGNPGSGGGMFISDSPGLIIEHCSFVENVTHYGAGVWCQNCAPTFVDCVFLANYGITDGGGLCCATNASPVVESCVFAGNRASRGGGVWCAVLSAPVFVNCTFYGNHSYDGGGAIYCTEESSPVLEKTIIAYSADGGAIEVEDAMSSATLTCCDVYGNTGGDWTGSIADQLGVNGNFSAPPLFCDTAGGDFTLEDCSPCLPGNHPDGYDCGGIIGAFGSGCGCGVPADPWTWGMIKAMYK